MHVAAVPSAVREPRSHQSCTAKFTPPPNPSQILRCRRPCNPPCTRKANCPSSSHSHSSNSFCRPSTWVFDVRLHLRPAAQARASHTGPVPSNHILGNAGLPSALLHQAQSSFSALLGARRPMIAMKPSVMKAKPQGNRIPMGRDNRASIGLRDGGTLAELRSISISATAEHSTGQQRSGTLVQHVSGPSACCISCDIHKRHAIRDAGQDCH